MFKKLRNWYLRKFIMCKCTAPEYEVRNNILCCSICGKPAVWEAKQR